MNNNDTRQDAPVAVLRGMATVNFFAVDHAAAKAWYAQLLGVEPYFDVPGYAEFRLGDYQHEFGLIDSSYAPHDVSSGPAGAVLYWQVDDLSGTLAALLAMGAKEIEGITERGEGTGFVTASVVDPFGNVLGIMNNPHYLEILAAPRAA